MTHFTLRTLGVLIVTFGFSHVVSAQESEKASESDTSDLSAAVDPDAILDGLNGDDIGLDGDDELDALLNLDIDDLEKVEAVSFDIEVTSVTKTKSTIGKSPAAITVITQEMIRRSGANSIPEVLRMVPGLQVGRNTSSKYAISSRGFNGQFANKLLVMIDGRSVYTQFFSGVYWEVEDLVLQDIERIEVIRGPGATVWGANAVNGVINITTKHAKDTQGTLITAGSGEQDRFITQFRQGYDAGNDMYVRVWGKYRDTDEQLLNGTGAGDDWRIGRVGARIDWMPEDGPDSVTILGQLYDGVQGQNFVNVPIATAPFVTDLPRQDSLPNGGHILGRWTHVFDEESQLSAQFYYHRLKRKEPNNDFSIDIFDFDFQHQFNLCEGHHITWGANHRLYTDSVDLVNPTALAVRDLTREINRSGIFIQDQIKLGDKVDLILGSKFSYNDLSRYEYQPTARMIYSPDETHAVWGAVSRAVRTPSRVEDDIILTQQQVAPAPPGMPFPIYGQILGNDRLQAEDLLSYELGYRAQESDTFSWDVAVFFNRYDDLLSTQVLGAPAGFPPAIPILLTSGGRGDAYGGELSATWQVDDNLLVRGWYSFLRLQNTSEGRVPRNSAFLMTTWDMSENLELDMITRYVDHLADDNVDSYINLDLRLGYAASENLYLSIVGQNLIDAAHQEFNETTAFNTSDQILRAVYAQVEWRY